MNKTGFNFGGEDIVVDTEFVGKVAVPKVALPLWRSHRGERVGEASHPGPTVMSLMTALELDPVLVTDSAYRCTRDRCHQAWRDWSVALARVPDDALPLAGREM